MERKTVVENLVKDVLTQVRSIWQHEIEMCDCMLDVSNAVDNTLDCYTPTNKKEFETYENEVRAKLVHLAVVEMRNK
jgi:hypothetical protein